MSCIFQMQCAHESFFFFFLEFCSVPHLKRDMKLPYAKKCDSRRFCFQRKKKDKGKRNNGWLLAMETVRRSVLIAHGLFIGQRPREARTLHGHHSTNCSYHLFSFCVSYLLTYIYIYIFFTPWGYHYSNCSHMNTGVVSIGYKCVFYSTLGPGLGLLSQLHINVPFCVCVICGACFSPFGRRNTSI